MSHFNYQLHTNMFAVQYNRSYLRRFESNKLRFGHARIYIYQIYTARAAHREWASKSSGGHVGRSKFNLRVTIVDQVEIYFHNNPIGEFVDKVEREWGDGRCDRE